VITVPLQATGAGPLACRKGPGGRLLLPAGLIVGESGRKEFGAGTALFHKGGARRPGTTPIAAGVVPSSTARRRHAPRGSLGPSPVRGEVPRTSRTVIH
jgi:hypothetical protein